MSARMCICICIIKQLSPHDRADDDNNDVDDEDCDLIKITIKS